jgi:hypothetical protein
MTDNCVYCGGESQGRFSIHRDGFGIGPEVPLCDSCGEGDDLTCADIWERIAQPAESEFAYRLPGDASAAD